MALLMLYVFLPVQFSAALEPRPALAVEGLKHLTPSAVVDVTDGDTVVLADGRVVRMVGIQAPKLPLGRKGFRKWPLADEAKAALSSMSLDMTVTPHTGGRDRDRWSRLLAHLENQDGLWLQGAMLRMGLARVYSFADNTALVGEMLALEALARADGLNIWSNPFYAIRSASGASGYENSFQLVEGVITTTANVRGRVYLNFGEDYHTDFTILIPPKVRRAFERAGQDLLELEGHNVRVRGWLKEYNGPMVELSHPEQLEVLGKAETKKDPL